MDVAGVMRLLVVQLLGSCDEVLDATSGGQQGRDATGPKWSAGCRRRLIGWIQINNHSDYLDGWLVGEK